MPNYLISLIGMAAIVTISGFICGWLMYKHEKENEPTSQLPGIDNSQVKPSNPQFVKETI